MKHIGTACLGLAAVLGLGCEDDNQHGLLRAEHIGALPDIPAPREPLELSAQAECGSTDHEAGEGLYRYPYLQQLGTTRAQVLWTAAEATPYTVEITTPEGDAVAKVPSAVDYAARPGDAFQHVAELEHLEPNRQYCYRLLSPDGEAVTDRLGLTTAPDGNEPMAFVAFGDSGYGGFDQANVFARMLERPFDLAVHTGDVAYDAGTLAQFERHVFQVYRPMLASVPMFPIAGNHDYKTAGGAPFREVFSLPDNGTPEGVEQYYSFDWGPVHFVGLDSEVMGTAQADWLDDDLAQTDKPWKLVFTHQPAYSSGKHGSNQAFRDLFGGILERRGVQLVLAGHDHHYERSKPINGVTYVVTGGGGRGTRDTGASSFTAFSIEVLHFVYVTVNSSELRLYAIDGTGQEFDFAKLTR
ncbi:MAG: metallophosphoesterase [Myxococcales bacterium]|nr:metallophosphoesterase [Myxococcales bacterium]